MKHTSGCAHEGAETTGAWGRQLAETHPKYGSSIQLARGPDKRSRSTGIKRNEQAPLQWTSNSALLSLPVQAHWWLSLERAGLYPHAEAASLARFPEVSGSME